MRQMTQPSAFMNSTVDVKGFTVEKDPNSLFSQGSTDDAQSNKL